MGTFSVGYNVAIGFSVPIQVGIRVRARKYKQALIKFTGFSGVTSFFTTKICYEEM